MYMGGKQLLK